MQQIADWLEKLGMSEYAQRFAENGISAAALPCCFDYGIPGRDWQRNGGCRKRWADEQRRLGRSRCRAQLPDGTKHFQPVSERDSEVFKVLISQVGKN